MLIIVQDKTRENYTRFLFFGTVRSATGLFLWPGLRAGRRVLHKSVARIARIARIV